MNDENLYPVEIPADELYRHMTTAEAAAWLALPKRSLDNARQHGTGPRYVKAGKSVRYRLLDLIDYQRTRFQRCTNEQIAA